MFKPRIRYLDRWSTALIIYILVWLF